MHLSQCFLPPFEQVRQRNHHACQNRPSLAPAGHAHVLVLVVILVLLQVKTILHLPVTQNQILEFRSRNLGGIKTTHKIVSFIRRKFTPFVNFLIKTQDRPAVRYFQLLTNIISRPLLYPQTANLNRALFLSTRRSPGFSFGASSKNNSICSKVFS